MRFTFFIATIMILFVACDCGKESTCYNSKDDQNEEVTVVADYLVKIFEGDEDFIGNPCGYATPDGEVVIPVGKYFYCYTDKFYTYAIVMDEDGSLYAINRDEEKLYDVFWYDNGPDYVENGLFRIVVDGKIGYASEETGEIVIEPKYECAYPFEEGKAKVTENCTQEKMDEHTMWESDEWYFIDIKGNIVE